MIRPLLGGLIAALLLVVACGDDEGPAEGLLQVDLGSFDVPDTGGDLGPIEFEVPDDATSALIWCGDYGDAALGAIYSLTDPSGSVVYDMDDEVTDYAPIGFRTDFLDDMAIGLIPSGPSLPLSAGVWSFTTFVGEGASAKANCGALFRTTPLSSSATLNVDLVFVGVGSITATTAPDDPAFQSALTEFKATYAKLGLTVSFNYADFSGDAERFAVVDVSDDDYSEFNDLLRTAQPEDARTLTFFFVQEISNSSVGGATILGKAGGPPGAAALSGTSKSGVVVSAIDYQEAPTDVARIMAHEGAHFLGLWHTTERDGSASDPLGGTPICPLSNDADSNGTLNSSECTGLGADNLMWWTLTAAAPTVVAQQKDVVLASPIAVSE